MYEDLLFEKDDNGVGVLTINKQRSMNVLSPDTIRQFHKFVTEQLPAENMKVVVVTGAGKKSFCRRGRRKADESDDDGWIQGLLRTRQRSL